MLEVLWIRPTADSRDLIRQRLMLEESPLYLPAGLPLLRQTLRDLRLAHLEARVFQGFLERTFANACRDWRAISPTEQRVILGHLIQTLDLPEIDPIKTKPGLIQAAQRIIREIKDAGIPRQDWPHALSQGKGPAFARLAEAYQTYLEDRHLTDQQDSQTRAAAHIEANGVSPAPTRIVVEGFATLTSAERRAIAAMSAHHPVTLYITYDPDRPALFQPTLDALGDWWQNAAQADAAPAPRPAHTFVEAPDPAREIAHVARTIKQMLLSEKHHPDEIAIISNQPDRHRELVRRMMSTYGIPVALPPEPLISAPVVQAILALLQGDEDAVKSPYLNAAPTCPLITPAPVADHCAALARALEPLNIEQHIISLMHQSQTPLDDEAAAHGARQISAYRAFLRILLRLERTYHMTGVATDVTSAYFLALLTQELSEATYPGQKRTPGPAVRFLVPAQAEGLRIPVVFIVGLADGNFPSARADDWIISDRHRRATRGLTTRAWHRQVQRLQFLRAVRTATEQLIFTRSLADADGTALLPSVFWEESLTQGAPVEKIPNTEVTPPHLDRVFSPGELMQRLIQVLRHGSPDPAEVDLAAQLTPIAPPDLAPRIEAEDARRSPRYTAHDGRLTDPETLSRLKAKVGQSHRYSASELETYAACPFRYLGERLLRLEAAEEEEPDLDAAEVGTALHHILAEFYRTPNLDLHTPQAEERLTALTHKEVDCATARLGPALQEAWRRQLLKQALAWLANERAIRAGAQASTQPEEQLTPTYLEWSFGQKLRPGVDPHSTTEPLRLGDYQVGGIIDRIDTDRQGGYTIYDYKTGKTPSINDIIKRKVRLQVPLYLIAARRLELPGAKSPIGGAYYGLRDRKRTGGIWRKSKKGVTGITYHGCQLDDAPFDEVLTDLEAHIIHLMDDLNSGDLTVNPRVPCPAYCPVRTVCRFDEARLEIKAGRAGKEGAE
ncbi:MAG TPA: PD-(D/E)XK nuclease family protein [Symbiobacteriaceae bacterium]|nr:PD-(D/E)XK nuclease family protein [Symbiobacteriaceae bacterium]